MNSHYPNCPPIVLVKITIALLACLLASCADKSSSYEDVRPNDTVEDYSAQSSSKVESSGYSKDTVKKNDPVDEISAFANKSRDVEVVAINLRDVSENATEDAHFKNGSIIPEKLIGSSGEELSLSKLRERNDLNNVVYRLRLQDKILFDSDEYQVKHGAKNIIEKVADYLNRIQQTHLSVYVIGHTDSTASSDYNQKLSEQRAISVSKVLALQNVDMSRVSILGMGENQPIASNDTKENRALNRRVEIFVGNNAILNERAILGHPCNTIECGSTELRVKSINRNGSIKTTERTLSYSPVYRKELLKTLTMREPLNITVERKPLLLNTKERKASF